MSSKEYPFSLRLFQDAKEVLSNIQKDGRYVVSRRL